MSKIKLELTIDEANLVLEALGQLPFARVYEVVDNIQRQANAQLNGQLQPGNESQPAAAPEIRGNKDAQ